jgi:GT2 family glycosyltransferase
MSISNPQRCDVSVIIVNWNTCALLRACLESVYSTTRSLTFEVIVVDNGSADDSIEMMQREFPDVRIIANRDNRGFAAANNQGIALATGRYVLLLNSDTVVLDDALAKTVAFADRCPEAAVTGCRILNTDRTLQESCFMFPSLLNFTLFATYLYRLFPQSRFFGREHMSWWRRDDVREVDVVTGCYMLVRREAIEDVGPMDESFFMYAEETDWCYRFRSRGWKSWFTPAAEIIHVGGGSAPKLSAKRAKIMNQSFTRYAFKHWSKPRACGAVGLMIAFYATRLMVVGPLFFIFRRDENYKQMVENHWAGLRDLLSVHMSCASRRIFLNKQ